jgi:hypothetical protein
MLKQFEKGVKTPFLFFRFSFHAVNDVANRKNRISNKKGRFNALHKIIIRSIRRLRRGDDSI